LTPIPFGVSAPVALLLLGAMISAFEHTRIDYRIVGYLNSFARRSQLLDRTMHAATTLVLLQGAVFISLIWYLWFARPDITSRGQLLAGTLTAAVAGMTSRALQLVLPSHLRPLHTPQLHFVLPISVDPDALNHFNSFPSDHGVVFFGLSAIIYRMSPRLGIGAFIWATAIDAARIYEGYHFPSDIIASAGLGVLMVNLLQAAPVRSLAQKARMLEERFRPIFYMFAFLATYQIASLFDDMRELGRGLLRVVLHHNPFVGG
jgi:undecaprenyl-diphosphatase